jgi:PP-loop superfamily ATP-utilizing enzyme
MNQFKSILGNVATRKGGFNVVAFSGGIDSTLVAAGLHSLFPHNTIAITGIVCPH